ncbi:MAG: Intracellular endo-alpha-(1-_5)-L-arabinanase [Verrucomicrobia bacterium ADurb.Bin070]|nr:MAG: Intracellular endo-alpha-(1->5)-L-arabinanase [Verrucomicrobia bacterium ADurb.Bin070]
MSVLPDGAVQAQAWLRHQLELQRDGLTGHAEELYDDIGRSDWLTGAGRGGQYAWERGPYYAKGLVALALALALDDAALKAKAKRWVDAILASQRPNGDFGPRARNWWANMIALWLVRDWCAATDDPRVPPFLERYFAFQAEELQRYALADESKWAMARGADELDVVLWLHARTGKKELEAFARLLSGQIADWSTYYHRGGDPSKAGCRSHIVNFMQGVKAPPLQWRVDGDPRHRDAYAAAFAPEGWIMQSFGRPDRMVNGSEPLSSRSASEGTELCAIAERILSNQVALGIWGDAAIGDDLETVAYNTLPATLAPDGRGMRYYNLLNLPHCVDGPYGFVNNGDKVGSLCSGPHAGFGCCRSNFHFAWPKFVQSLWMKTADNGLAATAYGPCTVTATAGGARVTVEETGTYPFGPDVKLAFREGTAKFPLKLRIPGWCRAPQVTVNGEAVAGVKPGSFCTVDRAWKPGDEVSLRFPMDVGVSTGWDQNAAAVTRGPLLYALTLAYEDQTVGSYEVPFEKRTVGDLNGFPRREIRATEPWNRALVLNARGGVDAEVETRDVPLNPFEPGSAPVSLKVKTIRTDYGGWGHTRDLLTARAVEPPPSPIAVEGEIQTAEFVPMGATQVRIVLFPWAGTYTNPVINAIGPADPDVLFYNGTYYLYCTGDNISYRVYTSRDLVNWTRKGRVFKPGEKNVWAPDLYADPDDGLIYLYYTVRERIGVAVAQSPEGPFEERARLVEDAIDAHLFRDDDGRLYLYYVQFPGFRITVQRMRTPLEKEGAPVELLRPTEPWEKTSGHVTEGPFLLKRQSTYYLIYSGTGADSPDYAVGYATAASPAGPFVKHPGNPVIRRGEGVFGPGHGCVVTDAKGALWHVYHQQRDESRGWNRFLCIDPLWFDERGVLHGKATRGTPQAAPAAER